MCHDPARRVRRNAPLEHRCLFWHEGLNGDQGVDKESVALWGWDSAGRCMGACNQAHLLQVGHDIADGGGREVEP